MEKDHSQKVQIHLVGWQGERREGEGKGEAVREREEGSGRKGERQTDSKG